MFTVLLHNNGRRSDHVEKIPFPPVTVFGTNNFKEGNIWHIDGLLGNDRETNNETTVTANQ
jgi:hypothetical protein